METQDTLTDLVAQLRKAVIRTELKRGSGPRRQVRARRKSVSASKATAAKASGSRKNASL